MIPFQIPVDTALPRCEPNHPTPETGSAALCSQITAVTLQSVMYSSMTRPFVPLCVCVCVLNRISVQEREVTVSHAIRPFPSEGDWFMHMSLCVNSCDKLVCI